MHPFPRLGARRATQRKQTDFCGEDHEEVRNVEKESGELSAPCIFTRMQCSLSFTALLLSLLHRLLTFVPSVTCWRWRTIRGW